jgi:hypothetical protein
VLVSFNVMIFFRAAAPRGGRPIFTLRLRFAPARLRRRRMLPSLCLSYALRYSRNNGGAIGVDLRLSRMHDSPVDFVDVLTHKENRMTSTEMDAFDEIRQLARKTAALTRAAENVLDAVIEVKDDTSRRRLEDLAHLIGAAAEAADATVDAGAQLAEDVCHDRRGAEA